MAQTTPHFLRFARALALVSGIAAPLASGCAMQHETDDTGSTPDASVADTSVADTSVADAGNDAPYVDPCASCDCVFGGDEPPPPNSCEAMGTPECCYAVGPLAPPELAA